MSSSPPHPRLRPALAFFLALFASCAGGIAAVMAVGWELAAAPRDRTVMEAMAMTSFALVAITLGLTLLIRGLTLWPVPRGRRHRR